jgi:exonuclease III
MNGKSVSLAALQETGWKVETDIMVQTKGYTGSIINFESEDGEYRGLGFYMSPQWRERLDSTKLVSSRVAVARFKAFGRGKLLTIINVYGPTMMRTKDHPELTEAFYNDLRGLYETEKRKAEFVIIMGDFNAKIGKKTDEDGNFMGSNGKGERNENGDGLRQFLEETGLYIANTHFRHRDRQIATWHGGKPSKRGKKRGDKLAAGLHNQIDYIVVPRMLMKLFTDAKAVGPLSYRTDHSMVIGKIQFKDLYKLPRASKETESIKRNLETLLIPELQQDYQDVVSGRLEAKREEDPTMSHRVKYEMIKETLLKSAQETLPREPIRRNGKIKYLDDSIIDELSKAQLKLTERIYHTKRKIDIAKKKKLRKQRNKIFKRLRERIKELDEQRIQSLATELETSKGNRRAYEVARIMAKTQNAPFSLYDAQGDKIYDKSIMINSITGFYSNFFAREGAEVIQPWRGEPRPLTRQISSGEVTAAAKRLRNHRALGPDNIPGELIKNGGKQLHLELANVFNDIFTTHETIDELKEGYLHTTNKPCKTKQAENTRPLVFLAAMRKVLSNITLTRILEKAERYLSLSQHAYRANRSTTEVSMTAQWLRATSERYAQRIHIMGIDLSKAFDCIDRKILLDIMERNEIGDEDDLRLVQFLISETKLQAKIGKTFGEKFDTIIGTPQGDALSPLLFLIYLEDIMRTAPTNHLLNIRDVTYLYADDVNYATTDEDEYRNEEHNEQQQYTPIAECLCAACRAYTLEGILPPHFAQYHMKMNATKTTHVEFVPKMTNQVKLSTLGNQVSGELECKARIQSANAAFNSMQRVWLRRLPISTETKMKLYNSCVKSRLLYNAGVSTYTRVELDKIDAAHRRHLRRLLGIFYPERIGNEDLYMTTESVPISVTITELRWTMLGHTLRRPVDTPGNKVIKQYYQRKIIATDKAKKTTNRGRVLTTLPRLLQRDIMEKIPTNQRRKALFAIDCLKTGTDLAKLRQKAQNRDLWKKSVNELVDNDLNQWKKRNDKKKAAREQAERKRRQTQPTIHEFFTRT